MGRRQSDRHTDISPFMYIDIFLIILIVTQRICLHQLSVRDIECAWERYLDLASVSTDITHVINSLNKVGKKEIRKYHFQ